jgi:putative aldouronate transport system permease protein
MRVYWTPGYIVFTVFNFIIVGILALSCVLPFINLLAISLSDSTSVGSGSVGLIPVNINFESYAFIMENARFWRASLVSLQRIAIVIPLTLILCILSAYPLSREPDEFKLRTPIMFFFVFTMLFGGGLIPQFIMYVRMRLIDSIWVLIIPGAFNIWNTIIMMHFIRGLPRELEEAAEIDGATKLQILYKVLVPLLKPSIATITLFTFVGYWNEWFAGFVFINMPSGWPLATYLQSIIIDPSTFFQQLSRGMDQTEMARFLAINDRTTEAAQLFVAMIPILLIYPFLQKHFAGGLVLGSVKG